MVPSLALPCVPVSWGELLDKLTILEIKHARIGNGSARANVARELAELSASGVAALHCDGLAPLIAALKAVNEDLWDIEDAIRAEEAEGRFGAEFIRLARAVYHTNDRRAALKRQINALLGSELVEEKSYWTAPAAAAVEGRSHHAEALQLH